jgi:hypothetical protein
VAAATAAAAPTSGELCSGLERTDDFFVEDEEGRQAHIGDFFLTQKNLLVYSGIRRRPIYWRLGGRATRKRQQASRTQHGHGLAAASLSHRHSLRL